MKSQCVQTVTEPKPIDLEIRESVEKVFEKSLNCAQKLGGKLLSGFKRSIMLT